MSLVACFIEVKGRFGLQQQNDKICVSREYTEVFFTYRSMTPYIRPYLSQSDQILGYF